MSRAGSCKRVVVSSCATLLAVGGLWTFGPASGTPKAWAAQAGGVSRKIYPPVIIEVGDKPHLHRPNREEYGGETTYYPCLIRPGRNSDQPARDCFEEGRVLFCTMVGHGRVAFYCECWHGDRLSNQSRNSGEAALVNRIAAAVQADLPELRLDRGPAAAGQRIRLADEEGRYLTVQVGASGQQARPQGPADPGDKRVIPHEHGGSGCIRSTSGPGFHDPSCNLPGLAHPDETETGCQWFMTATGMLKYNCYHTNVNFWEVDRIAVERDLVQRVTAAVDRFVSTGSTERTGVGADSLAHVHGSGAP